MNGITRWRKMQQEPFSLLRTALDKAMDDFHNVESLLETPFFPHERHKGLSITPSVDIVNDKKIFKAEFEIPGMGKDDIKVSIADGILTIKGKKKTSRKDEGKDYVMREIAYGECERSIALPDSVDIKKAKATFKKGMLWVNIPKKPESTKECREIKIQEVEE